MRRDRPLYIMEMKPADIIAIALSLATLPVAAVAQDGTRDVNALRDQARAQERQARALERIQGQFREQALQDDRDRRNAARDARSSRRFDRP